LQPEVGKIDSEMSEEENCVNRDTLFFEWKPDVEEDEIEFKLKESDEGEDQQCNVTERVDG